MMYYRGFFENSGCFGFNYFPYWYFFAVGVILIGVILLILKRTNNDNLSPLDILNNRFINGELSQDEYLRKKELLDKK